MFKNPKQEQWMQEHHPELIQKLMGNQSPQQLPTPDLMPKPPAPQAMDFMKLRSMFKAPRVARIK